LGRSCQIKGDVFVAEITHRTVRTNGIDMHIAEAGSGPPVIMCHGFPELWYSWRHQLPALADAGFHAIVPDQRGYGRTDKPPAIEDYDIHHLAGDMLGLLDALGEDKAVFVGHDWGAPVVWNLAIAHPDRVRGVAALSVPFSPRGDRRPTEVWKFLFGDNFFYILYFQEPGVADAELGADPHKSMSRILTAIGGDGALIGPLPAKGTGFLTAMPDPPALPSWLSREELDYFVSEFARTGFTGGLNWYRNFDRNWETTADLSGKRVTVPALFIGGDRDPVIRMVSPDTLDAWCDDLRGKAILPGAGHWTQQERPVEVNEALLTFLKGL
jgi:pimeloyl-ACP methyl ester carboxylesterase